jgi:hypothetical protein
MFSVQITSGAAQARLEYRKEQTPVFVFFLVTTEVPAATFRCQRRSGGHGLDGEIEMGWNAIIVDIAGRR